MVRVQLTARPVSNEDGAEPVVCYANPVPATADKMLEKSLTTSSDVIIYDLEDSVPPSPADKHGARSRLAHFLSVRVHEQEAQ